MLEASINDIQLKQLNRDLELTGRELLKIATRAFKTSAKNFTKNAIKIIKKNYGIADKKLRQRIRQYVIDDLKIKIFAGFYRTGLTNWQARKTKRGVTYGRPRRLRKGAFIARMPEGGKIAVKRTGQYHTPSKGRYANKVYQRNTAKHKKGEPYKVEILEKQVTENNEIENVVMPILQNETENFYKIFKKSFESEVNKYLRNQFKKGLK